MHAELTNDDTITIDPSLSDTVRLARQAFDQYQRRKVLEGRWARRHPIYARMLHWPGFGRSLRERRERFVRRMLELV